MNVFVIARKTQVVSPTEAKTGKTLYLSHKSMLGKEGSVNMASVVGPPGMVKRHKKTRETSNKLYFLKICSLIG